MKGMAMVSMCECECNDGDHAMGMSKTDAGWFHFFKFTCDDYFRVFINGGTPIAGWFTMENPTGGTPILGHLHMVKWEM